MEPPRFTPAAAGWALYGTGARAVGSVVFMIAPLLLVAAARADDGAAAGGAANFSSSVFHGTAKLTAHRLQPTSVPTVTITVALLGQCIGAPLLAYLADAKGLRRQLLAAHVVLGLVCLGCLGFLEGGAPVFAQAALVALLYYATSLAWMFQNSLLPSVATAARRPTLSLASAALSNLGGAAFLLLQYRVLAEDHAERPADEAPSPEALRVVCLLAAGSWAASALPALLCLSTLPAERHPKPADDGQPADGRAADGRPLGPAAVAGRRPAAWRGVMLEGVFGAARRMRRHTHASRFIAAQTLYLTAATADGASASLFAQEVVGLAVPTIVLLTIYAALSGACGAILTLVLARCLPPRPLLIGLMSVPPVLLLYTSCVLVSEREFLVVMLLRAFVAGGVGFQGLNRGVFAQMVPRGREAEFFGVYFVSVKATSWIGPLACAVINELTGSLRTSILSALAFYLSSLLIMCATDFDVARAEAGLAPGCAGAAPSGAAGASTSLLAAEAAAPGRKGYGTAA